MAHKIVQIFVLGSALFSPPRLAYARPEWLLARDLDGLVGIPRDSLVVVSNQGTREKPNFRLYYPGIVPLNQQGQMIWFGDDLWQKELISNIDQIILKDEWYGPPAKRSLELIGCSPEQGLLVKAKRNGKMPNDRELFLTRCGTEILKTIPRPSSRVAYDLKHGFLESSKYIYKYKTSNHMLFESVQFKDSSLGRTEVASDADLLIRADIKNFFTMQFDSDDIVSKMKAARSDSLGAFSTLSFYLSVLFFKISLDLTTDVRFFEDSAHIPMVLTLPVDAQKRLHALSGVLYSFALPNPAVEVSRVEMPVLASVPAGAQTGLNYCAGSQCLYTLEFALKDELTPRLFQMELTLPRRLVELGMFPHFVSDVAARAKDMKWSLTKTQQSQRRVGLYLEVSGLPKGEFPWDFWMTLAGESLRPRS